MSIGLAQELDRIAERVTALAGIVATLREENRVLQIAIDQKDGENKLLRDRLDTARGRLETLIARIPAEP